MGKNRRCIPGCGAVPCVSGTRRRRLRSATSNQKDGTSPTPQSRPRSPSPPSLSGAGRRSYRIAGEAPRATLASTTNLNQKEQLHNQNTPKRLSPILLHAHSQLRAPSRRSSRLGGENEPNKELQGLSPPRIRKRCSANQEPSHLTPSRANPKTKAKAKKATTIIRDIYISNVTLVRPQNKGGNPGGNNQTTGVNHHPDEDTSEWYKCAYVITVDNGKCGAMGGGRIKVWTDKKAWLANEPAHLICVG